MYSRLGRPLLGIALSGALLAGGATFASPALASDPEIRTSATRTAINTPSVLGRSSHPGAVPGALTGATVSQSGVPIQPTLAAEPPPADDDPPPPAEDPTPVDTTAPVGSYELSLTSVWVGQRITLTDLGVTDDVSGAEGITRTVTWGDGVTSTLTPGAEPIGKRYAKAGKFTVTVTLTDEAGNTATAALANSVVTVTMPGKTKLSPTSVFTGGIFAITFSSVPAGTTRITLDWGDGYVQNFAGKNQTIRGYYYRTKSGALINGGIRTLKAAYTNQNGTSSPILIGNVIIKRDQWIPTVKITKPAKPSKVKSWSTLRGTAADRGAGLYNVQVWVFRTSPAGYTYCYTSKKTWVYTPDGSCYGILLNVTKGKWSLKMNKLAKGILEVQAKSLDWTDKQSKQATVIQKLTS
jgi:hypothetical protein